MNRLKKIQTNIQNKRTTLLNTQQLYNTILPPLYSQHFKAVYNLIKNNPNIYLPDLQNGERQKQRHNGLEQVLKFVDEIKIDMKNEPQHFSASFYALSSLGVGNPTKILGHFLLFMKTLVTYNHLPEHQKFIKEGNECRQFGNFALTQFHHGSYSKGIKTQAFYEHQTQTFRITTNGMEGMKFWIGNCSQIAGVGIIWADLIVKEKSFGPHPFVVPFRDKDNHKLLDKVTILDCGPKFGCNLIDNGGIILDNVRVPKENLLGKLGCVDENGEYQSKIKSHDQRFGLHMSPLSTGRAILGIVTLNQSIISLKIALNYVHHRRQFSKETERLQNLLIDYPLTKNRLLVPLAKTLVFYFAGFYVVDLYNKNKDNFIDPSKKIVNQLHAISASLKAKSSWFASSVITGCRQMLGGHGYSSFSGLDKIYSDNDINMTWEGDNNMLLQQTSKFLLKFIPQNKKGQILDLRFVNERKEEAKIKMQKQELMKVENLEKIIKHLLIMSFHDAAEEQKMMKREKKGDIWNELQPHFCNNLSLIFGDYFYFSVAQQRINNVKNGENKKMLLTCLRVFVLDIVLRQKYGSTSQRKIVQELIIQLTQSLLPYSLEIVDTISPPSDILKSAFASEDGMKTYLQRVWTEQNTFKTIQWHEKLRNLRQNK